MAGRPKGSKNLMSTQVKDRLRQILDISIENTLQEDLGMMTPEERVAAETKLLALIVTKDTSTEIELSVQKHPFVGNAIELTDEERAEIGLLAISKSNEDE